MKCFGGILLLVALCYAKPAFNPTLNAPWEKFKGIHHKLYSGEENDVRREIWENNVAKIIQHNLEYDLGQHSYRMGLNKYADMSHQEFVNTLNGLKSNHTLKSSITYIPPANLNLPASVNWKNEGLVTAVKDQGQCGSCWAFSAVGSLEGQHKKKTGTLVSLSEQNLIDCSVSDGNGGCKGGTMEAAFEYIKKNGGINTEESYPYTAKDGPCRYNPATIGATITGHVEIPSGDEYALQSAVSNIGPVSAAIDAKHSSFQLYSDGIYSEPNCSPKKLSHAVLVVGYGTADGKDFYIAKNSWGTSWGEDGYIRMARNKNNHCGISTQASYPLV